MFIKDFLIFFIIIFSCNNILAIDRVLTIKNNCQFDVLWTISGTPIKDNGKIVTCNNPSEFCFNGNGICGDNGQCYFKYPTILAGADNNPGFYLTAGTVKAYKIALINRNEQSNIPIMQYEISIAAQYGCNKNQNGFYSCLSAECERVTNINSPIFSYCKPDTSLSIPFTRATITFNEKQNDIYALNIINGTNLPIAITPNGNLGTQPEVNQPLFCKTTGGPPTGNNENMKGCSWEFTPPFNPHVFTSIYRDLNNKTNCITNNNCTDPDNPVCGLKYPEDLKTYNNSGYCGMPIGYLTATAICSLPDASTNLTKLFNCTRNNTDQGQKITENSPIFMRCPDDFFEANLSGFVDSTKQFCNYELYQCESKTYEYNDIEYKYLDSCYKYNDPNQTDAAALGACCGCMDWENVPKNKKNTCTKPLQKWLELVKPKLQWLIDGCPDASEYQYGNEHSNLQCTNQNPPTNSDNNLNYTITFCPNGQGLFKNELALGDYYASKTSIDQEQNHICELDDYIDDFSKYIYLLLITIMAGLFFWVYHYKIRKPETKRLKVKKRK